MHIMRSDCMWLDLIQVDCPVSEDTRFSLLTPGDIPLHLNIRETSDKGQPVVVSFPDSPEVSESCWILVLFFIGFHYLLTVSLSWSLGAKIWYTTLVACIDKWQNWNANIVYLLYTIYSWSQKFTNTLQNLQHVNYFTKIRGIIQNACHWLFNWPE